MIRALVGVLLLSLISGPASAKLCKVRVVSEAMMPGVDVGPFTAAVREKLPQSKRCRPDDPGEQCYVRDQLGYEYWLKDVPLHARDQGNYAFVIGKFAQRGQKTPLPIGLFWDETRASALAKLRRVGSTFQYYGDTDPGRLRTDYCFRARTGEPFAFVLEFSKAGRLTGVRQEMEYQW